MLQIWVMHAVAHGVTLRTESQQPQIWFQPAALCCMSFPLPLFLLFTVTLFNKKTSQKQYFLKGYKVHSLTQGRHWDIFRFWGRKNDTKSDFTLDGWWRNISTILMWLEGRRKLVIQNTDSMLINLIVIGSANWEWNIFTGGVCNYSEAQRVAAAALWGIGLRTDGLLTSTEELQQLVLLKLELLCCQMGDFLMCQVNLLCDTSNSSFFTKIDLFVLLAVDLVEQMLTMRSCIFRIRLTSVSSVSNIKYNMPFICGIIPNPLRQPHSEYLVPLYSEGRHHYSWYVLNSHQNNLEG